MLWLRSNRVVLDSVIVEIKIGIIILYVFIFDEMYSEFVREYEFVVCVYV